MKTHSLSRLARSTMRPLALAGSLGAALTSQAAPPASWQGPGIGAPGANPGALNLQPGQLVGTCFSRASNTTFASDPEGFVLAAFDTRNPTAEGAIPGNLWRTDSNDPANGPFYRYHGDKMRAKVLGEIFGVCVSRENNPDIWVAGTSAYFDDADDWDPTIAPNDTLPPAPAQLGKVYRIDNVTGNPVDVVALNPNNPVGTRPAELGNICWNRSSDGNSWVYVSNLNDGLIYRLEAQNLQGSQLTYDHGVDGRPNEVGLAAIADNPSTEFTSGERAVWGLQVSPLDGRLYYSVWNGSSTASEIWSVELDPSNGDFLPATARLDITVPYTATYNTPVASLSFSADGTQLFAAERGHAGMSGANAHSCRVLEWTYDTGSASWVIVPEITPAPTFKYFMGSTFSGQNSAGGVQPDCQGNVWVSGNFFAGTTAGSFVYGAQRIPAGGNFATPAEQQGSTSLWIDYNDDDSQTAKHGIGALAMWEPCACMNVEIAEIDCPDRPEDPFQVTVNVTNLVDTSASIAWLLPCPEDQLPDGATTATPDPSDLFNLPSTINLGETTTITFSVPFANAGETVCLSLSLFTAALEECCTEKFCFDLPRCDCAEILEEDVSSEVLVNGDIKHTITLTVQNQTHLSANPYPFHFSAVPPQPGFVTFNATPNPDPILPGDVGTVTYCYLCPLQQQPCPDKLNFTIAFHDGSIENCCSIEACVELEPVGKVADPDRCEIIVRNAPLCFDPDTGLWFADIRVRICNNFCEPRTYEYVVDPTSGPITGVTPNGGAVGPIAPGDCRTVSFRIFGEFQIGEQGLYEITFQPTDGGLPVTCTGQVTRPEQPVKFIDIDDDVISADPRVDNSVVLNYLAENTSDQAVTMPLSLTSEFGTFLISVGEEKPERLALDTTIKLEPGEKQPFTVTLQFADRERRDLPRFVDVSILVPEGAGFVYSRSVEVRSAPRVAGLTAPVRCVNCSELSPVTPGQGGLFRLVVEVSVESALVGVDQTASIPDWNEAGVRLSPDGEETKQVTLTQGQHVLYIAHPESDRCFFRLRYE